MTEDIVEVDCPPGIGTPKIPLDAPEDWEIKSISSDDTTDGCDDDTDGGETTTEEEEEEEEEDENEDEEMIDSEDEDCDEDTDSSEIFNNDYSYYDDREMRWVEKGELEAAELYMRRTANAHRFITADLQEKLEEAAALIGKLMDREKVLKEMYLELRREKEALQKGQEQAELVPRLREENRALSQRLQEATRLNMELQAEVQNVFRTQEKLAKAETVALVGVKLTLCGNRVVRQDTFDIDQLLSEVRRKEVHANELLQKMEQSSAEIRRLSENGRSLQHANSELESTKKSLEQLVTQLRPSLSAAETELASQRHANSVLEQRNRQLEEQLRRVSACAGPLALGTGEQSLMDRARGTPGMFSRQPVRITLSVTQ